MYGGDLDSPLAPRDAQRAPAALLVPPAEEERDVGDLRGPEGDDLLVHGLQVGDLRAVLREVVAHDDPLERLLGRQQTDRAEEALLVVVERAVERAVEKAVVDGPFERVVGVHGEPEGGDDEPGDRGVAHHERLLRHHVEAVAGIGVASFEVEQLGGDLRAVRRAPHEDQDVARGESLVQQRADALHDGRPFVVDVDRDIARCVPPSRGVCAWPR